MYSATIGVDKDGVIRIRIAKGDPQRDDDVRLIEVLYGDDVEKLKELATKFARERIA